ncbi:MAG: hypothetical protein V4584_10935 [Verrucomicrobiota bacterium]
MKKRHQSNSQESASHPLMINYLALIHAVTHPASRPVISKHHRSSKSAATALG